MTDAVKIALPDAEHAKRMGWKYHIQWYDEGRICFYRRKTFMLAKRQFDTLTDQGYCPFVVGAITGEPVNMGAARD